MTHNIKNCIAGIAMVAVLAMGGVSVASASEVTGTLTSGAMQGSGGTGSTVSGTIGGTTGGGSTITGTVTGGSSGGGGSSSSGGGGGGGGVIGGPLAVGSVNADSSGTSNPGGLVLGTSTIAEPGVPNTGEGGTAPLAWTWVVLAALAAGVSGYGITRRFAKQ